MVSGLLIVVIYKITRVFSKSVAMQAVAFNIIKAFDWVLHVNLLHKLRSCGLSGRVAIDPTFETITKH